MHGGLARIVLGRQAAANPGARGGCAAKRHTGPMRLVLGERPTLVFALTTRICRMSISIDAVILKVIRYVKEFTNGGTPSRSGLNSQVSDKGGPVVKRLAVIAVIMVAAITVFTACGSDTETPPATPQRASPPIPPAAPVVTLPPADGSPTLLGLTVELKDNGGLGPFAFDPVDFSFNAGEAVNFTFTSESQLHTFTVDDLDIDVAVGGDETVGFSFTFDKPGTYELICIPHRALGMVGTITVSETPASQAPAPSAPAPAAPAAAPAAATELTVDLTDNGGLGPFEFGPPNFSFNAGEAVNFTFEPVPEVEIADRGSG